MNTQFVLAITILISTTPVLAQSPHGVRPYTEGNRIELTLVNTSSQSMGGFAVAAVEAPDWIRFTTLQGSTAEIAPNTDLTIPFTFSVDRKVSIGQTGIIRFTLLGDSEESWEKEIHLEVLAPEEYRLYQNYPNPFNPTTTISYQLPKVSHVRLTIYNIVGQRITTIIDEAQGPGYHETVWDVKRLASGTYFYELRADGNDGSTFVDRKKVMVLK
jgi:hypothetical protein